MSDNIKEILGQVKAGQLSEQEALVRIKALRRSRTEPPMLEQWLERLKALFAEESKLAPEAVKTREPVQNYGIDSLLINRLNARLEEWLGPISKTLFYEHNTLLDLAAHLLEAHPEKVEMLAARKGAVKEPSKSPPGPLAGTEKFHCRFSLQLGP